MTCKFCNSQRQIILTQYIPILRSGLNDKERKILRGIHIDCPKCKGTGNVIR